jgi:hypothetical protein
VSGRDSPDSVIRGTARRWRRNSSSRICWRACPRQLHDSPDRNITVTTGKTSAPSSPSWGGKLDTRPDSRAVTFGQVNPLVPDSVVSDWQAGVVFVDQKRLRQGITGYIQVLEFGASPQGQGGPELSCDRPNALGQRAVYVRQSPVRSSSLDARCCREHQTSGDASRQPAGSSPQR